MIRVSLAVEGSTDLPVVTQLVALIQAKPLPVLVARSKSRLDPVLPGLNRTAVNRNWLILRDLDHDAPCPPELIPKLLDGAARAARLSLRIPVRATEAWLLADAPAFSRTFRIAIKHFPTEPDALPSPKQHLVNLCRRSVRKQIRRAMTPHPRSGRQVGPEYTSRITAFAEQHWNPRRASGRSPSLDRTIRALRLLAERGIWT